jgi:hypothetical protein
VKDSPNKTSRKGKGTKTIKKREFRKTVENVVEGPFPTTLVLEQFDQQRDV